MAFRSLLFGPSPQITSIISLGSLMNLTRISHCPPSPRENGAQMVVGVEPEVQPRDLRAVDLPPVQSNSDRTFSQALQLCPVAGRNVPPVFQALLQAGEDYDSRICREFLDTASRLPNRCEHAASPRTATAMKKPGLANYAESGLFGAEHRVRTGDLRLGKANRPSHQRSLLLTNRHQPSKTIRAA